MMSDEFKTIPANIFNIEIRQKYPEFEKDYKNLKLSLNELTKKYTPYYKRLRREYEARGGKIRKFKRRNGYGNYYYYNKKAGKYIVARRINNKVTYFGSYKTENGAKNRVKELNENGWIK